jgi:phospholipid/cholesterol/gamma-HCH transport system permease protein
MISDFTGVFGGFVVSYFLIRLTPAQYWTTTYRNLKFVDLSQGLVKPFAFAFMVALVGCYYGITTRGGTQGVGRSTTQAVVTASILVIALDFVISKLYIRG